MNNEVTVKMYSSLGEFTGKKDIMGVDIKTGDIVEFWYNHYYDSSFTAPISSECTKMVDVVVCGGGEPSLLCNLGMSAYLWRHSENCKVIGNVKDNKKILKEEGFGDWIYEVFNLV